MIDPFDESEVLPIPIRSWLSGSPFKDDGITYQNYAEDEFEEDNNFGWEDGGEMGDLHNYFPPEAEEAEEQQTPLDGLEASGERNDNDDDDDDEDDDYDFDENEENVESIQKQEEDLYSQTSQQSAQEYKAAVIKAEKLATKGIDQDLEDMYDLLSDEEDDQEEKEGGEEEEEDNEVDEEGDISVEDAAENNEREATKEEGVDGDAVPVASMMFDQLSAQDLENIVEEYHELLTYMHTPRGTGAVAEAPKSVGQTKSAIQTRLATPSAPKQASRQLFDEEEGVQDDDNNKDDEEEEEEFEEEEKEEEEEEEEDEFEEDDEEGEEDEGDEEEEGDEDEEQRMANYDPNSLFPQGEFLFPGEDLMRVKLKKTTAAANQPLKPPPLRKGPKKDALIAKGGKLKSKKDVNSSRYNEAQHRNLNPTAGKRKKGTLLLQYTSDDVKQRTNAQLKQKMYLSQLVEKRKMEEEEMLKMMEKEQEKRKKFREALIEKAAKTRQDKLQQEEELQRREIDVPLSQRDDQDQRPQKKVKPPAAPVVAPPSGIVERGNKGSRGQSRESKSKDEKEKEKEMVSEEELERIKALRKKFKDQHKQMLLSLMLKNKEQELQLEEDLLQKALFKQQHKQTTKKYLQDREQSQSQRPPLIPEPEVGGDHHTEKKSTQATNKTRRTRSVSFSAEPNQNEDEMEHVIDDVGLPPFITPQKKSSSAPSKMTPAVGSALSVIRAQKKDHHGPADDPAASHLAAQHTPITSNQSANNINPSAQPPPVPPPHAKKVLDYLVALTSLKKEEELKKQQEESRQLKRKQLLSQRLLREAAERKLMTTEDLLYQQALLKKLQAEADEAAQKPKKRKVVVPSTTSSTSVTPSSALAANVSKKELENDTKATNSNNAKPPQPRKPKPVPTTPAAATSSSNNNGVASSSNTVVATTSTVPARDFGDWKKKNHVPTDAKVFCMTGWYPCVKTALLDRGWYHNSDSASPYCHLKWTLRSVDIAPDTLQAWQLTNHFAKNIAITTKAGLAKSLKEAKWCGNANAGMFFPRAYDLTNKEEILGLLEDYLCQTICNKLKSWLLQVAEQSLQTVWLPPASTVKEGAEDEEKKEGVEDTVTKLLSSCPIQLKQSDINNKNNKAMMINNGVFEVLCTLLETLLLPYHDDYVDHMDPFHTNLSTASIYLPKPPSPYTSSVIPLATLGFDTRFISDLYSEIVDGYDLHTAYPNGSNSGNNNTSYEPIDLFLRKQCTTSYLTTSTGGATNTTNTNPNSNLGSSVDYASSGTTGALLVGEGGNNGVASSTTTVGGNGKGNGRVFSAAEIQKEKKRLTRQYEEVRNYLTSHLGTLRQTTQADIDRVYQLLVMVGMWYYGEEQERLNNSTTSPPEVVLSNDVESVGPGKNMWIVKPAAKSRGRGIMTFGNLRKMLKYVELLPSAGGAGGNNGEDEKGEGNGSNNNTGSGSTSTAQQWIVQKYMENSLLIAKRKFDVRQWVLVTSWSPLTIYFYNECYARFSVEEYDNSSAAGLANVYAHLVNNSIGKNSEKFDAGFVAENGMKIEGCMWSYAVWKEYMKFHYANRTKTKKDNGGQGDTEEERDIVEEYIKPRMKDIAVWTLMAARDSIEHRKNSWELYGFDYMVDDSYTPWLIEINSSPACDYSTPVTERYVQLALVELLSVVLDTRDWQEKYRNVRNTSNRPSPPDTGGWECIYEGISVDLPLGSLGMELSIKGDGIQTKRSNNNANNANRITAYNSSSINMNVNNNSNSNNMASAINTISYGNNNSNNVIAANTSSKVTSSSSANSNSNSNTNSNPQFTLPAQSVSEKIKPRISPQQQQEPQKKNRTEKKDNKNKDRKKGSPSGGDGDDLFDDSDEENTGNKEVDDEDEKENEDVDDGTAELMIPVGQNNNSNTTTTANNAKNNNNKKKSQSSGAVSVPIKVFTVEF